MGNESGEGEMGNKAYDHVCCIFSHSANTLTHSAMESCTLDVFNIQCKCNSNWLNVFWTGTRSQWI